MNNNLVLTYALLAHLKESSNNPSGSLIDIFIPIAKKGLYEYSKEHGLSEIKGKSFSEIQLKIMEVFSLEIPLPVLDVILKQIRNEINDHNIFSIYNDGAFIIKSYIFTELESKIEEESENINFLKEDYKKFCMLSGYNFDFHELQSFILAQKVDLFSDRNSTYLNLNYNIPKYISFKFQDEKIFKIITNIYLGGIISSYLSLKISKHVTDTELLLDTNFFISLIDLNTEDANNICNQLYKICKDLGFRFTMLYSTVEQIKILLNTRINDFASKDLIGTVKCADVFNACIRRKLDKTHLERIKDSITELLNKFSITIISEYQIKDIIEKAQKSSIYKELKVKRTSDISALNDTVAELYVMKKRGGFISEFSDVKCWFLHNSFNTFYFAQNNKIHDRISISANELLVLLWLSNPSQISIEDSKKFAKGGLASYITKYRRNKMPSTETIKAIKERANKILEQGDIEEKDFYRICIRMSEGHLNQDEATILIESNDHEFTSKFLQFSKEEENNSEVLKSIISNKDEKLIQKELEIENLKKDNILLNEEMIKREDEIRLINSKIFELELSKYNSEKSIFINDKINKYKKINLIKITFYIIFLIIIATLWLINNNYSKFISNQLSTFFAFILFIVYPLIPWFINHNSIFEGIKYICNKSFRNKIKSNFENNYDIDFPFKDSTIRTKY